jgi:hypothetical protein
MDNENLEKIKTNPFFRIVKECNVQPVLKISKGLEVEAVSFNLSFNLSFSVEEARRLNLVLTEISKIKIEDEQIEQDCHAFAFGFAVNLLSLLKANLKI